jgi:proteic killer suppression protein
MNVRFGNECLDRMEVDAEEDCGFSPAVVTAFRKRMQMIRAARDERDFYALKSLHYEKLKGDKSGQRSIRLNDQWRLIIEIEGKAEEKVAVIVSIEDYH